MNDLYSKAVFTIIAISLIVIAARQLDSQAIAQGAQCGSQKNPCIVLRGYYNPSNYQTEVCGTHGRFPC